MVASKPKKPWQMTRTEYLGAVAAKQWPAVNMPRLQLEGEALQHELRHVYYEGHKQIIQRALSEGKPVPSEVLKDYPELARSAKLHVGVKAGKPEPIKGTMQSKAPHS